MPFANVANTVTRKVVKCEIREGQNTERWTLNVSIDGTERKTDVDVLLESGYRLKNDEKKPYVATRKRALISLNKLCQCASIHHTLAISYTKWLRSHNFDPVTVEGEYENIHPSDLYVPFETLPILWHQYPHIEVFGVFAAHPRAQGGKSAKTWSRHWLPSGEPYRFALCGEYIFPAASQNATTYNPTMPDRKPEESEIDFGPTKFSFNNRSYHVRLGGIMKAAGRSDDQRKAFIKANPPHKDIWMHPIEAQQHCIRWGANDLAQKLAAIADLEIPSAVNLEELKRLYADHYITQRDGRFIVLWKDETYCPQPHVNISWMEVESMHHSVDVRKRFLTWKATLQAKIKKRHLAVNHMIWGQYLPIPDVKEECTKPDRGMFKGMLEAIKEFEDNAGKSPQVSASEQITPSAKRGPNTPTPEPSHSREKTPPVQRSAGSRGTPPGASQPVQYINPAHLTVGNPTPNPTKKARLDPANG